MMNISRMVIGKTWPDRQRTRWFLYVEASRCRTWLRNQKLSKQDKALAIIEQTTTPQERVLTSTIFYLKEPEPLTINQPAIVIIGEVVRLFRSPEIAMQTTSFFGEEHWVMSSKKFMSGLEQNWRL